MGQPGAGDTASRLEECIVQSREPGELKHLTYPEEKRSFPE
jgi:hypothetical protein